MARADQTSTTGTLAAARSCLEQGDLPGVERHCRDLLAQDPDRHEGWFLLGSAALRGGQPGVARGFLARATGLAPGRAEYLAALARSYSMTWHHPRAAALAREALATGPDDPPVLNELGHILLLADRPDEALPVLQKAARGAPDSAEFQFNYASACRVVGQLGNAKAACEAALKADPDYFRAWSMLADLQGGKLDEHSLADLQRAFGSLAPTQVEAALHLGNALFRALEGRGRYAEAMQVLVRSKVPAQQLLGYEFADDQALFDALQRLSRPLRVGANELAAVTGKPIFVMGMPRSGTTLLERMLSSHPEVGTAGEVHNFGILLQRAAGDAGLGVPSPEVLSRAAQTDLAKLGEDYLASVRPRIGDEPYFVDKLPHNFLYAGFIAGALPAAPLVCMRRHPMDTCLGNFRQLFALGFPYYRFSYDLEDTARYFIAFDKLLRHWQALMPGRILEVQYESLVTQPETELRRVLAHCGLEWDPACLAYARNESPVSSASAVQVREGLNTRAFGRWRHYAKELSGVRTLLEQSGIEIVPDAGALP